MPVCTTPATYSGTPCVVSHVHQPVGVAMSQSRRTGVPYQGSVCLTTFRDEDEVQLTVT
jgi:hypothetical protein